MHYPVHGIRIKERSERLTLHGNSMAFQSVDVSARSDSWPPRCPFSFYFSYFYIFLSSLWRLPDLQKLASSTGINGPPSACLFHYPDRDSWRRTGQLFQLAECSCQWTSSSFFHKYSTKNAIQWYAIKLITRLRNLHVQQNDDISSRSFR